MAKARAPRLKVFQAQFGFYDTVVAAPSQAAALRAWGTHQNLFESGDARLATDEAAMKAALAHPEAPLRRAVGSDGSFVLDPADLPKVPPAPKRTAGPAGKMRTKAQPAERPPPDRKKLDAAEAALRSLDEGREAQEAALRREADDLEARRTAAEETYLAARKTAVAARAAARTAYREAGGMD